MSATLRIGRRSFLLGLAASLASRSSAQEPVRPVILVLTSDASERSSQIAAAFKKSCDFAIRMSYELGAEADAGAFIADNIRGQTVSLVFAIGPAALKVAAREFAGTPIVFAEVAEGAMAAGMTDAIGVSTRLDPTETVERLLRVHPGMARLGLLHASGPADPYWTHVEEAVRTLGVKPVVKVVTSSDEVDNAFKALLAATDLIWLQQEPRIWTGTAVSRVLHEASLLRRPVVSFNRVHMDAATPPAVVAYGLPEGVGITAATMARSLVFSEEAPRFSYVRPMLVGHVRALRLSGLTVNPRAAEAFDELIGL